MIVARWFRRTPDTGALSRNVGMCNLVRIRVGGGVVHVDGEMTHFLSPRFSHVTPQFVNIPLGGGRRGPWLLLLSQQVTDNRQDKLG